LEIATAPNQRMNHARQLRCGANRSPTADAVRTVTLIARRSSTVLVALPSGVLFIHWRGRPWLHPTKGRYHDWSHAHCCFKAYAGKRALIQLDFEYSVGVHGYAVVPKNTNGTSTIKQGDDVGPLGVWSIRQGRREGNKYGEESG
jgi:hypothetical protein